MKIRIVSISDEEAASTAEAVANPQRHALQIQKATQDYRLLGDFNLFFFQPITLGLTLDGDSLGAAKLCDLVVNYQIVEDVEYGSGYADYTDTLTGCIEVCGESFTVSRSNSGHVQ